MNDGLADALRHNSWATRELLAVCQNLTHAQLDATTPGTYGSIIATWRHTIASEAGYCARLTGEPFPWIQAARASASLDELIRHLDGLESRWDRFLAHQFDAEQTFVVTWHDGIDRNVPAGIFAAQAIHHGTEHRAHLCTILTTLGVETPDLGLWDFAEATNRATQETGVASVSPSPPIA